MNVLLSDLWSDILYQKLTLSCIVLLGAAGLRRFLGHLIVDRVPDDSPHVCTLRKFTQYVVIASQTLTIQQLPLNRPN